MAVPAGLTENWPGPGTPDAGCSRTVPSSTWVALAVNPLPVITYWAAAGSTVPPAGSMPAAMVSGTSAVRNAPALPGVVTSSRTWYRPGAGRPQVDRRSSPGAG